MSYTVILQKSHIQSFKFQLFHIKKKMLMLKLYNRFHVGKNEIRIGNSEKLVFFQIFN